MSSRKSRCAGGIIALRSFTDISPSALPSYLAGTMMSTPKGRPPTSSVIQAMSMSSCSGVWPAAPSTPKPPALETAATTSRQ